MGTPNLVKLLRNRPGVLRRTHSCSPRDRDPSVRCSRLAYRLDNEVS